MKDKIKKELNILSENNVISQDEINENLAKLKAEKKSLARERATINKKMKKLDEQIEYWVNMLPNQTSLF